MDRRRRWQVLAGVALICIVAGAAEAATGCGSERRQARAARTSVSKAVGAARPHRGPRSHRGWRRHRGSVPILMYHAVEAPPPDAVYPDLYLGARTFAAQMRWLARHGYQGVTLSQTEDAWTRGGRLPRKPIVVSFDDGNRSNYTRAFPVLRRLGWPGVLNLTLGNLKWSGGLSFRQVARMIDAGWELASHTISHPDLTTLTNGQLRHEVRDSRRVLRHVFRVPVQNFAYPAGRYDARVVEALRAAGYRGAVTTVPGVASRQRPFELKRIRVDRADGVSGLRRRLSELPGTPGGPG